ncbi:14892_t:CDS:2 [Acaulospora colombiana]|uniref:14892_t:CDS:1 n=1 Tax=Acaulospora colombiana TaxID=27376 RepID=A0ACA9KWY5_9GLOM|nr:14892_t:CDS:2 [Acaulospora colombiana]
MYPKNVGILAIEIYFPKRYVDQNRLEEYDGVSTGKYTIGLGQTKMGFCDDREGEVKVNAIVIPILLAVQNLIEKYKISYRDIGRLEVGTETIIDKSKSVKTLLMQLFEESGNTDVEGIDTTNACYGGTSALLNSLNWIESSSWDGRYALVVAGDIAIYDSGPARPTGGAGCVAMLLGKDAPIVFDRGLRATHMENAWDFYKPNMSSEFPEVDGHFSNICYLRSLDICYNRYLEKLAAKNLGTEEALLSKDLEKAFTAISKVDYIKKVKPTLLVSTNVGNMYCASLYACLVTVLSNVPNEELVGKRIGMFSYGSGLSSTLFSFRIVKPVTEICKMLDISNRLESRVEVTPAQFVETLRLREKTNGKKDFNVVGDGSSVEEAFFEGTYYLDRIDSKWRRTYKRHTKRAR